MRKHDTGHVSVQVLGRLRALRRPPGVAGAELSRAFETAGVRFEGGVEPGQVVGFDVVFGDGGGAEFGFESFAENFVGSLLGGGEDEFLAGEAVDGRVQGTALLAFGRGRAVLFWEFSRLAAICWGVAMGYFLSVSRYTRK